MLLAEREEKRIEFNPSEPIFSFPHELMSLYLQANTEDTITRYSPNTPEKRVFQQENGSIFIPNDVTFQDLLSLSKLISPNHKDEKNDPVTTFVKRLQDGAILLSRQQAFQDKAYDQFIEQVYNFGASLEWNKERRVRDELFVAKPREEIQKMSVENPLGIGARKDARYQDSTFLFLLGKETYLHTFYQERKHPQDVQNTFYSKLFSRWSEVHAIKQIDEAVLSKFDAYLLSRPSLLAPFLRNGINDSLYERQFRKWRIANSIEGKTEETSQKFEKYLQENLILRKKIDESTVTSHRITPLLQVTEQVVEQNIDYAIDKKRNEQIKTNLPLPPLQYVGDDIRELVKKAHGEDVSHKKLFEIIGPVYEMFLLQKGSEINIQEKLRFFWEFVQAYPYNETYHPAKMVSGAFECNLKVLVLGLLYEEYLGDEIIILGDIMKNHIALTILPKNSTNTLSALIYSVDPSYQRETGSSFYEQGLQWVMDGEIMHALQKFYSSDMTTTTITVHKRAENVSDNPNQSDFGLQTHHFAHFLLATNIGILRNLRTLRSNTVIKNAKAIKQLELDPYNGFFWYELLEQIESSENIEPATSNPYLLAKKAVLEHAKKLDQDTLPILIDLYSLADEKEAEEILNFILTEKMSNARVQEWIFLGRVSFRKTKNDFVYLEALKKFPEDFKLCLLMGQIKINTNDLLEVAKYLITCSKNRPEDANLLAEFGNFYSKIQSKEELDLINARTELKLFPLKKVMSICSSVMQRAQAENNDKEYVKAAMIIDKLEILLLQDKFF